MEFEHKNRTRCCLRPKYGSAASRSIKKTSAVKRILTKIFREEEEFKEKMKQINLNVDVVKSN